MVLEYETKPTLAPTSQALLQTDMQAMIAKEVQTFTTQANPIGNFRTIDG